MSANRAIDEALSAAMPAEACRPVDLRIDRKTGLRVAWADGEVSEYPLDYLRRNCPCATCRAERESGGTLEGGIGTPAPAGGESSGKSIPLAILPRGADRAATFADAKLVGNYAIQITWGDGHSTGIYDFKYLRVIAAHKR